MRIINLQDFLKYIHIIYNLKVYNYINNDIYIIRIDIYASGIIIRGLNHILSAVPTFDEIEQYYRLAEVLQKQL